MMQTFRSTKSENERSDREMKEKVYTVYLAATDHIKSTRERITSPQNKIQQ